MKSKIVDEPVVVGFVKAAVLLAAAFGLNVGNEVAETAIDVLSLALVVRTVVRTRGKVSPV